MKALKLLRQAVMLGIAGAIATACATDFQSDLEKAKFDLDAGDYNSAIESATSAFAVDDQDPVAARILANAYFARSGFDFLNLAEGLTTMQDSTEPNFALMASYMSRGSSLTDLRTAVSTLESLDYADVAVFDTEEKADAIFDLAIMQMVESFAIGIFEGSYYTSLDVTGIDDTNRSTVQDDLLDFDNRMIASGIDPSEQLIQETRQTFCMLEPLSAGDGFTTSEYRTLVACQLSSNPDALNTTAIDAGIANCSALNPDGQSAAVQACYTSDTAL